MGAANEIFATTRRWRIASPRDCMNESSPAKAICRQRLPSAFS